jgi:hypothetical protein
MPNGAAQGRNAFDPSATAAEDGNEEDQEGEGEADESQAVRIAYSASQLINPTSSQAVTPASELQGMSQAPVPAASWVVPTAAQFVPAATQFVPAAAQFVPATPGIVSTQTTDSGLVSGSRTTSIQSPLSTTSSTGKRSRPDFPGFDDYTTPQNASSTGRSSVGTGSGPSKKKKSTGNTSIPSSMQDAVMAAASSQKGARRGAAVVTVTDSPLLIGVTGAMSQLAGSIERSMQPPSERRAARVQSAMRVLEEQDHDLRVEVRLFLLQLFERDDYAIDVFTMIHDKDLRVLWVQQKYDDHMTGGSSGPPHSAPPNM